MTNYYEFFEYYAELDKMEYEGLLDTFGINTDVYVK